MKKKSALRHALGIACSSAVAAFTVGTPTLYAADGSWSSNSAGNWSDTTKWTSGTVASGADFTATLGNVINANRIITLNTPITIGNITAADTTHNYTIARDANPNTNILTLDRTDSVVPTIDVAASTVVGQTRTLTITSIIEGNDGLKKTGAGTLILGTEALDNTHNYTGGTQILAGTLFLNETGQIPASSGTVILGDTSGTASAELSLDDTGTDVSNAMTVNAGSSGTKTIANRGNNSVSYSGNITANDNLTILGANDSGNFAISGTANTIASAKTVAFSLTAANTIQPNKFVTDSAIWSGDGGIFYTSAGGLNNIGISGAKTYTGGAALNAMSGTGIVEVRTSSAGPANAPTSGPFGTGTLSIGATKMRADEAADITIGNAISFTDNPTFTTVASEKSLMFSGDASLGADRTLTVETGSTVATAEVEFSGAISGSGFGITKQGAGNLVLSGTNSYDGATNVNNGTLLVNGSTSASSAVSVGAGATLGGNGTINGTVSVAATANLAPGASAGTLTIDDDLDISALAGDSGLLKFELDAIGTSDKIAVTGTLTVGSGALDLNDFSFTDLGGLQNGTYTLISSGAAVSGTLGATTNGTLGLATIDLQISGSGTDIELVVSGIVAGAPEIAVEQPETSDIPNSSGSRDFGTATIGTDNDLVFTIRNTGTADLNLTGSPRVDVVSGDTGDFSIQAQPSTPVAQGGGTTTFTVRFNPTATGSRSATVSIANNDSDENPFTFTVEGTGQTAYQAWADGAAFGADDNGDGVSNGLAFLLGAANKDVSALSLLPTVTQSAGDLILNFSMLNEANRGDADVSVLHSSDLGILDAWLASDVVPDVAGTSPTVNGVSFNVTLGSPKNTVIATVSSSQASSGKLFGRLQATEN